VIWNSDIFSKKIIKRGPDVEAYVSNPSYSKGRDGSRPAWAKLSSQIIS
jgi:hypothetical protein